MGGLTGTIDQFLTRKLDLVSREFDAVSRRSWSGFFDTVVDASRVGLICRKDLASGTCFRGAGDSWNMSLGRTTCGGGRVSLFS